jgi:hypothetical protein
MPINGTIRCLTVVLPYRYKPILYEVFLYNELFNEVVTNALASYTK